MSELSLSKTILIPPHWFFLWVRLLRPLAQAHSPGAASMPFVLPEAVKSHLFLLAAQSLMSPPVFSIPPTSPVWALVTPEPLCSLPALFLLFSYPCSAG